MVLHGGCLDDVVYSRDELKSGPRSVCVLIISKVSTLVLSLKRFCEYEIFTERDYSGGLIWHLPDLSNLIGQRGFFTVQTVKNKRIHAHPLHPMRQVQSCKNGKWFTWFISIWAFVTHLYKNALLCLRSSAYVALMVTLKRKQQI